MYQRCRRQQHWHHQTWRRTLVSAPLVGVTRACGAGRDFPPATQIRAPGDVTTVPSDTTREGKGCGGVGWEGRDGEEGRWLLFLSSDEGCIRAMCTLSRWDLPCLVTTCSRFCSCLLSDKLHPAYQPKKKRFSSSHSHCIYLQKNNNFKKHPRIRKIWKKNRAMCQEIFIHLFTKRDLFNPLYLYFTMES